MSGNRPIERGMRLWVIGMAEAHGLPSRSLVRTYRRLSAFALLDNKGAPALLVSEGKLLSHLRIDQGTCRHWKCKIAQIGENGKDFL